MKSIALLAVATVSLALLSCASDGAGPGDLAAADYDAYYDDAYGPFYDGYWGGDGAFYHRERPEQPHVRDQGGHFQHSPGAGFHGVHSGGRPGGHSGGGRR